ncbi:ACP-R5 [Ixodes scapularis]
MRLRRSDMRHMQRARNRTLRLTIIIVLAFFWCWTPYVTMVLWYQFDPDGAVHVNGYLQSSLFMFAVSNSCVNPLVYGSYSSSRKGRWCRRCPFSETGISSKTTTMAPPSVHQAVAAAVKVPPTGDCSLFSSDSSVYPYEVTIRFKGSVARTTSAGGGGPVYSCSNCSAFAGENQSCSRIESSSFRQPKKTSSQINHSM